MKIRLTIIKIDPIQDGTSQAGNTWRKRNVLGKTLGNYPKMVCVEVWGERCDNQLLVVGNTLDISIDLESREYNGKYYTTAKAYDIAVATVEPAAQPMPSQAIQTPTTIPTVPQAPPQAQTMRAGSVIYPDQLPGIPMQGVQVPGMPEQSTGLPF